MPHPCRVFCDRAGFLTFLDTACIVRKDGASVFLLLTRGTIRLAALGPEPLHGKPGRIRSSAV